MTWSEIYLFCFIVGFALSLFSFFAGAVHIHLPFISTCRFTAAITLAVCASVATAMELQGKEAPDEGARFPGSTPQPSWPFSPGLVGRAIC